MHTLIKWKKGDDCWTNIGSPGLVREQKLRGYLEIRRHGLWIVVSDLERGRPIWFGGKDWPKESLDIFYQWLGAKKVKKIRLAVMDKELS